MYLSLQILQTGRHRVPQPLDVDLNFQMGGVLGKSVTFEANYVTANTSPQCAQLFSLNVSPLNSSYYGAIHVMSNFLIERLIIIYFRVFPLFSDGLVKSTLKLVRFPPPSQSLRSILYKPVFLPSKFYL